jgi:microsomal epoxide hydrolase
MMTASRRAFLASLPRLGAGVVSVPLLTGAMAEAQARPAPHPFRIAVPDATLRRIRDRVRTARFPDRLEAPDWRYGANWDYMRRLADHWATRYDWRRAEAALNRYPQFTAEAAGSSIHFFHVRGKGPRPLPLVLTHGWPGSVLEFQEAIGPLTDPAAFGGSAEDAFDVVVPSLPGFGFSSKPRVPVGPPTTARMWHELMTSVLGYRRYGAQGGDWGGSVTVELGRQFPQALAGIHLNATGAAGPATTDEERAWQQAAAAYRAAEVDYFGQQQHKPATVAFALYDNPLGAAAWIVEKFRVWSDSGTGVDPVFSFDQLITNVMLYLVTDTVGTAVWYYRGAADDRSAGGPVPRSVPVGFASFPAEMPMLNPPRTMLERAFNLVRYTRMPRGGHFACFEQPQLVVDDLRAFYRPLRG